MGDAEVLMERLREQSLECAKEKKVLFDRIDQLETELKQLKKDCEPFQAQIDQYKTYKVNQPLV